MTTRDLLAALAPHPDAPLAFDPGSGPIAPGYHVTEFKAVSVRALDCGGASTTWNETVLQVVPPARPEPHGMTVDRFLTIWRRSETALPLDPDAEVRVETAGPDGVAVNYLVDAVAADNSSVTVRLAAPAVACKGNDRSVGDIPRLRESSTTAGSTSGCCAPLPLAQRASEPPCCG